MKPYSISCRMKNPKFEMFYYSAEDDIMNGGNVDYGDYVSSYTRIIPSKDNPYQWIATHLINNDFNVIESSLSLECEAGT